MTRLGPKILNPSDGYLGLDLFVKRKEFIIFLSVGALFLLLVLFRLTIRRVVRVGLVHG